ncbi:MAG: universal stress protein [Longimicrobiaceae bacterium]
MSKSIRSIVLGVAALRGDDPHGARGEDPALASATALAGSFGAELHVVHAFEFPAPALAGLGLPPLDERLRGTWMAEIGRRLVAQASRFAGTEISCHAVEGSPTMTLCEVARQFCADLLVVGATRRGRIWRGILGSTAEGVVRASTVPVLVLHQPLSLPLKRILLTTDLSDQSVALLKQGLETVESLVGTDAGLELLVVLGFDAMAPPPYSENVLRERAGAVLERIAGELGSSVETRVRIGEPVVEIVREVEEWNADLLVVGTYGRSGFRRHWLGSTAAAATRSAGCNVLVLPGAPVRQPVGARRVVRGPRRAVAALAT